MEVDVSPNGRKALYHLLSGALDACDILVDDTKIPKVFKNLAHNVIKGVDETASEALSGRKTLGEASTVKREEDNTQPTEKPMLIENTEIDNNDNGGF